MPDHTIRHRDGTLVSQGSFNALIAENDKLDGYRCALKKMIAWHAMDHENTPAGTIQEAYDSMIESVRSALSA